MIVLHSLDDPLLVDLLQQGKVGIMPTDTIYGIVASAANADAVRRLYGIKHREHKPGTIIAADIKQLIALGLDETAVTGAGKFWPNPVSIIIPAGPQLDYLDQEVGSLAVRVPALADVHALLQKTGPLVTSSANHPGQAPANTVDEARAYFGDEVDFYVDTGDLSGRPPSTVARLADGHLQVLRQGAFRVE